MAYIVSENLTTEAKKAGFKAEVVSSNHPSDGGPVAIACCHSVEEAKYIAMALNTIESM